MTTEKFYNIVRDQLFVGGFNPSQMKGMNLVIAECRTMRVNRQGAAYCLATAYHETGSRLIPVREGFANSNKSAIRAVTGLFDKGRISRNYALIDRETGQSYFGRGLVQLTWKSNYERAGNALDLDLVNNPDLMLDPAISARVLVRGMRDGWFTGVSLDDVSEPQTSTPDFTNDRKIVNGSDRAKLIADYADSFYEALADVDLLAESRTIKAVKKQKKAGLIGKITVAGGTGMTLVHEALGSSDSLIGVVTSTQSLSQYLPWAGGALALLGIAAFIYMKSQGDEIEKARREDNEMKGV